VKNKLIRLAELIQENYPEKIVAGFRSSENLSLTQRLELINEAINFHRTRAETLWLKAGRKRTTAEKRASAQAELAAFVFAYLTGDGKEYADSAIEALKALGRQGEVDLIKALLRR
jgi:ATP-dependent exoDNAse (exonuclease V) alpha subunit